MTHPSGLNIGVFSTRLLQPEPATLQHRRSFKFQRAHSFDTTTPLMEQTPSLEISVTVPAIQCDRDICNRKLSQALAKRVKVRAGNGNDSGTMLVCPDCYIYYRDKTSTTTRKFLAFFFHATLKPSSYRSRHSISVICQHSRNSQEYCRISKGCVVFTRFLRHAYIFTFR